MSREDPQLRVRIPQKLKDELEEMAKLNCRSPTAEIVLRLQESIDESKKPMTDQEFRDWSELEDLKEILSHQKDIIDSQKSSIENLTQSILKLSTEIERLSRSK